jgi:hypothetical protein
MADARHCVMGEITISVSWNYYVTIFYKILLDKQFNKYCFFVCVRKSHFLGEEVFDSKRAGRNNDNCVLKGTANFEKAKSFFLLLSICTSHIKLNFWWYSVGTIRHSYRALIGEIWRSGEPNPKRKLHYKLFYLLKPRSFSSLNLPPE